VGIEHFVQAADEMAPASPGMRLLRSETAAIRSALNAWLDDVTAAKYPRRAWALRHALFVDDLGTLAFRDVVLRDADGTETHERNVLVDG
jgi:hypothetical protein